MFRRCSIWAALGFDPRSANLAHRAGEGVTSQEDLVRPGSSRSSSPGTSLPVMAV
jgi:hypothetical protein